MDDWVCGYADGWIAGWAAGLMRTHTPVVTLQLPVVTNEHEEVDDSVVTAEVQKKIDNDRKRMREKKRQRHTQKKTN